MRLSTLILTAVFTLILPYTSQAALSCETALKIQSLSVKFNLLHRQKHLRLLDVPRFPDQIINYSDVEAYVAEIEYFLAHITEINSSLTAPRQEVLEKDLNSLYRYVRQFRKNNPKKDFNLDTINARLIGFRNQVKGLSFETYISLQLMGMSFVDIKRSIDTSAYFDRRFFIESNNVELDFTGKLNGEHYWFEFKSVKPLSPASLNSTVQGIIKQVRVRKRLLKRLGPKKHKLIVVLRYGLGDTNHQAFLKAGADQVIAIKENPLIPTQ